MFGPDILYKPAPFTALINEIHELYPWDIPKAAAEKDEIDILPPAVAKGNPLCKLLVGLLVLNYHIYRI